MTSRLSSRSPSFPPHGSEKHSANSPLEPYCFVAGTEQHSDEQAPTDSALLDLLTLRIQGDPLCRCMRQEGLSDEFFYFIKFKHNSGGKCWPARLQGGLCVPDKGLHTRCGSGLHMCPGGSVILSFLWLSSTRGKNQSKFFHENMSLCEKSAPRSILYKV